MFAWQTLCKLLLASTDFRWQDYPNLGDVAAAQVQQREKETHMNTSVETNWTEHPDHALPEGLLEVGAGGNISIELTGLKVRMSARAYPGGPEEHFHVHLGDTLHEVFEKAAHALHEPLLPHPPAQPLDFFRMRRHNGEWGEPIADFQLPLWKALAEGFSRHVAVEYRLIVRINTKWGVPSSADMTPRALLTEFGFDPAQFSLYKPHGGQPLPPDTPIHLCRSEHFEAQKDGRYGGASPSVLVRGFQTIEEDVTRLNAEGANLAIFNVGGQIYVEGRRVEIPSPPWSSSTANILVAIPATYPQGGLDAFYLEAGVTQDGSVPRQQSTAVILDRTWSLISWHYANNRPWDPRADDIGTHIEHCRGFFLARGVTQ